MIDKEEIAKRCREMEQKYGGNYEAFMFEGRVYLVNLARLVVEPSYEPLNLGTRLDL